MRIPASLAPSLRLFRHAPIYALAVIGSLALAVATTCAAWAVVNRAFLDPLPYQDAGRLVGVQTVTDGRRAGLSIFVTEDLRQSPLFSGLAPFRFASVTYEAPQSAERLQALEVTPDYFTVIGVRATLGTVLTHEVADGVVVSAAFFSRALASDASALGRPIAIDGVPRTIVGIMPADFVPAVFRERGRLAAAQHAGSPRGHRPRAPHRDGHRASGAGGDARDRAGLPDGVLR